MAEQLSSQNHHQEPLFQWAEYDFFAGTERPKHQLPVFVAACEQQADYGARQYESVQQLMGDMNHAVAQLNLALIEGDLNDEFVHIEGTGIAAAAMTATDDNEGVELRMSSEADAGDDLMALMGATKRSGFLRGFTYSIEPISGTTGETLYRPVVSYLLGYGQGKTPYGGVELYARAPVDTVVIEYSEDRLQRLAEEAYRELRQLNDPTIDGLVNEMCFALNQSDMDAATIQYISKLSRDLHNVPALTLRGSDAIVDLVSAHINPTGEYDLSTSHAYLLDDEGKMTDVGFEDGSTIEYSDPMSNIIIAPGLKSKKDNPKYVEPTAVNDLFFVSEAPDSTLYIPFRHINQFKVAS